MTPHLWHSQSVFLLTRSPWVSKNIGTETYRLLHNISLPVQQEMPITSSLVHWCFREQVDVRLILLYSRSFPFFFFLCRKERELLPLDHFLYQLRMRRKLRAATLQQWMSFCKQCHHLKQAELVVYKVIICIAKLVVDTLNAELPDLSQVSLRFTKYNMIHSDKNNKGKH